MFKSSQLQSESCSDRVNYATSARALRKRCRSSRILRIVVRSTLILFAGLASASAHANLSCGILNVNKTLTAGVVSVPVNSTAGTTVSTLAPSLFQPNCSFPSGGLNDTSATLYVDLKPTASLAAGFNDVYNTDIAGIGVRYTFNSSTCSATNVVLANGLATLSCPVTGPLNGPRVPFDINVTATLVVTGAVAAGSTNLTTAPVVGVTYRTSDAGGGSYWTQTPLYSGSATGTFVGATCSVSQPSVAVTLPNVSTGALSSRVGSTAGSQPFSLSFNCSAGAKVLITLSDNVNPANRTDTLQSTADSTAKGVGVQVLKGGSPVLFGADSAAVGNANQWLIGDSPNGVLQVPLTARYISTGSVTAGTVKALATFTMSYQ